MKTLTDIEAIQREYLIPAEIAGVLDMDPQDIRDHVHKAIVKHERPYEFPTVISGSRIKFPKAAFLKYMRGGDNGCGNTL